VKVFLEETWRIWKVNGFEKAVLKVGSVEVQKSSIYSN
jgi:hypothetical protein